MHKLLTLIIAAGILYTIVQTKYADEVNKVPARNELGVTSDNEKSPNKKEKTESAGERELSGNFLEKTLSKVLINALKTEEGRLFFENILQPINKPIASGDHGFKVNNANLIPSMFKVNDFDVNPNANGPAVCGHVVTLNYQISTLNGTIVDEQKKTYTLGSRPVIPGLDIIAVGMFEGQTRQAIIPARFAYYDEKYMKDGVNPESFYKLSVQLHGILPHNFIKDGEVKIFDDEISYKMPLTCGDKAIFDAKVVSLKDGKVVYDSAKSGKPLNMKIGDINYPMIFSYALHSKIPIGSRTVIGQGKFFQSLGTGSGVIFNKGELAKDEYFMLELTNFKTE